MNHFIVVWERITGGSLLQNSIWAQKMCLILLPSMGKQGGLLCFAPLSFCWRLLITDCWLLLCKYSSRWIPQTSVAIWFPTCPLFHTSSPNGIVKQSCCCSEIFLVILDIRVFFVVVFFHHLLVNALQWFHVLKVVLNESHCWFLSSISV